VRAEVAARLLAIDGIAPVEPRISDRNHPDRCTYLSME
jgi:hypothetical protein